MTDGLGNWNRAWYSLTTGVWDGWLVGSADGLEVGLSVGLIGALEGFLVKLFNGCLLGEDDGDLEGLAIKLFDGWLLGEDGCLLGLNIGALEGSSVDTIVFLLGDGEGGMVDKDDGWTAGGTDGGLYVWYKDRTKMIGKILLQLQNVEKESKLHLALTSLGKGVGVCAWRK